MPEKDMSIWVGVITAIGTLGVFLGLKARERKVIDDEIDILHGRITILGDKHSNLRVELARDYPTIPRIEKLMDDGFKRHTAEMTIIIHRLIKDSRARGNKG